MAPDGFGATRLTENAAGNNENRLTRDAPTANTVDDVEPYWFPNNAKSAFRGDEVNPANANIWVLTLDENGNPTGEQRLTTHAAGDVLPAVSPDGKLIVFASNRDGDWEIYVMKAAPEGATNVPRQLTKNAWTTPNPNQMRDHDPDRSPSGKQLVFESNRDGEVFCLLIPRHLQGGLGRHPSEEPHRGLLRRGESLLATCAVGKRSERPG